MLLLMIGPALWWLSNARDVIVEPPSTRITPQPAESSPAGAGGRASSGATLLYAVAVDDTLRTGHVPPGSEVEIWVRWDRGHRRRPRLQKLAPKVMLEEIVPAFTPDGPDAAMLRVPTSQIQSSCGPSATAISGPLSSPTARSSDPAFESLAGRPRTTSAPGDQGRDALPARR